MFSAPLKKRIFVPLLGLAAVGALALLVSHTFDGGRRHSDGWTMLALGKNIGDANLQLKADTGCFVSKPLALFDPAAAAAPENNFCGLTFGNTWARPYLRAYPTTPAGDLVMDRIAPGVTAHLPPPETVDGWERFDIEFRQVPAEVIRQALLECTGTDQPPALPGRAEDDRCLTTANLDDGQPGNFRVRYFARELTPVAAAI